MTPEIPDACQCAPSCATHDELTLEMVTEEDPSSCGTFICTGETHASESGYPSPPGTAAGWGTTQDRTSKCHPFSLPDPPSSTTETRSGWETTSILKIVTGCAPPCNGQMAKMPVSPMRVKTAFTCRHQERSILLYQDQRCGSTGRSPFPISPHPPFVRNPQAKSRLGRGPTRSLITKNTPLC